MGRARHDGQGGARRCRSASWSGSGAAGGPGRGRPPPPAPGRAARSSWDQASVTSGSWPGTVGVQGDAVHVEGQLPGRAADPAFGGRRPVDPEPDLAQVQGIEGAGGIGRLEGGPDGRSSGGHVGLLDRRGARDGRGHQDQGGHPLGVGQGEIEGDLAAHGVPDQHHLVEATGVEHGHQVDHLVVGLGLAGGGAEAPAVVGHDVHVGGRGGPARRPSCGGRRCRRGRRPRAACPRRRGAHRPGGPARQARSSAVAGRGRPGSLHRAKCTDRPGRRIDGGGSAPAKLVRCRANVTTCCGPSKSAGSASSSCGSPTSWARPRGSTSPRPSWRTPSMRA